MSLKDLFKEKNYQYLAPSSQNDLTGNVESTGYIEFYLKNKNRFKPLVDYSNPANFARFGSAEKYYYDGVKNITQTYPYDGSKKEKILWEISSSQLDLYIFENGYPRTTGYATFTTSSLTATDTSEEYGAAGTASYEYIYVNGGPHEGTGKAVYLDPDTGEAKYRKNANIWDTSESRECNLKIGGTSGNTVEFWLKKADFDPTATEKEVIFDTHTVSSVSSSAAYGRLRIEMSGHGVGTNTLSPFYVTFMSGTDGIYNQNIGSSITTASIADDSWHHYAFRLKNTGSNVVTDLFIDGIHNHRVTAGTAINYVSGTIVGTIGALVTSPSGSHSGAPRAAKGWGKLSGSIDEFRYWKRWRRSDQIQLRWFDQVGGGTNTDDANTGLGVYFKFNEGVTTTGSIDQTVLDYSGRVSNGSWTGWNALYSRNTGSAIDDSNMTTYTTTEFKDPILYSTHPDVSDFLTSQRNKGKEYDHANQSNLLYSLPSWILEDHDASRPENEGIIENSLWNLTQIMCSHFDDLATHINTVPKLTQLDYLNDSQKPIPFMDRILESKNFITPEIFSALDALEAFEDRTLNKSYTESIHDIKNIILQNIHNNLDYIYKTKGTEKSFRNLVRCFGVDDDIYRFNLYGNNSEFIFRDNYRTVSERYKLINFNYKQNYSATIYQYSSSLNANSTTFISASKNYDSLTSPESNLPFSVEASVIFPHRALEYADTRQMSYGSDDLINNYPLVLTASLFGTHTAIDTIPKITQWNSNDYANFVVKAVKPETYSDKAYFVLTGTDGGFIPELSSSEFSEVYSNKNWNFMVSLYPEKYLNAGIVAGTSGSAHGDYIVEFAGVQSIVNTVISEFSVTGSMTAEQATKFLASPKRVFAGSHRTNFTGTLITPTDIKMSNLRVWQNKLDITDLRKHASDPDSYGIRNPAQNAYLFNSSINTTYVPNKETLLLHWNYDNVTGSDASGEFIVEDLTSGSATQINRYGWLSELNKQQYLGKGYDFTTSSAKICLIDEFVTAKPQLPEVLGSDDMITVMENDDIYYTRDSRPTFFDLYAEKSPYQNISDGMMKFMSTVVEFNNIIGHPVHRYRHEYKPMNILRELFFQRIEDAPDVDKYIEYFKWFDIAVTAMIQKIAPMSSGLDERPLRTVIESHILERNKYQSKFPSYEFKQSDPQASMLGVAGMLYDWKHGHAPISEEENENCFWWKDRALRDNPTISSDDADVDSNRNTILEIINNQNNAAAPNLSGSSGAYEGSTYAIRKFARPYKLNVDAQKQIHGGTNFNRNRKIDYWQSENRTDLQINPYASVAPSDYVATSSCDDALAPNQKESRFFSFLKDGINSNITSPFNLVSASTNSSAGVYGATNQFEIVNLHYDTYGYAAETPMQSPFTDAQVGGHQRRHVPFSTGSDSCVTRPELFRIHTIDGLDYLWVFSSDQAPGGGLGTNMPRAEYYRDGIAKRPVNIANINYNTGSRMLGNYSKGYEIVMTNGRSVNNRFLAESTGQILTASADNYYVSGAVDFALPRRDLTGSNKYIIANRFSAPGDPATMAEGMLDVEAGEYSVYNALPWRNLSVRQPLNELQADHCKQFGYFSDAFDSASYVLAGETYPGTSGSVSAANYDGSASFHKVNRNGRLQPYLSENSLDTYTNTKVLYFDGQDSYMIIGTAAVWDAIIGNDLTGETDQTYTLSAWVNADDLDPTFGGGLPRIFDFGESDITFYANASGKLYFTNRFETSEGKWHTTDDAISINQWYHVAVTYDASNADNIPKIYVDGYEVDITEETTPQGANYGIVTDPCAIGTNLDGGSADNNWEGYIDEPSIWDAVLTPSQIEEIYLGSANYVYRSGPGRLNKHSAAGEEGSLISWWRADHWQGGTVALEDDYGSNDATLRNYAMVVDNDGSDV